MADVLAIVVFLSLWVPCGAVGGALAFWIGTKRIGAPCPKDIRPYGWAVSLIGGPLTIPAVLLAFVFWDYLP